MTFGLGRHPAWHRRRNRCGLGFASGMGRRGWGHFPLGGLGTELAVRDGRQAHRWRCRHCTRLSARRTARPLSAARSTDAAPPCVPVNQCLLGTRSSPAVSQARTQRLGLNALGSKHRRSLSWRPRLPRVTFGTRARRSPRSSSGTRRECAQQCPRARAAELHAFARQLPCQTGLARKSRTPTPLGPVPNPAPRLCFVTARHWVRLTGTEAAAQRERPPTG